MEQSPAQQVAHWLVDRRCFFFVGDGISRVEPSPDPPVPARTQLLKSIRGIVCPNGQDVEFDERVILQTLDDATEDKWIEIGKMMGSMYSDAMRSPGAGHERLSTIRPDLVVTTNYDGLIEEAMRKTGLNPDVMRSDVEVVESGSRLPVVVKLHGDAAAIRQEADSVSRSKSERAKMISSMFVLSPTQYSKFFRKRRLMALQLSLWWAQRHVVILGQSLDERDVATMLKELHALLLREGLEWLNGYWVDTAEPGKAANLVRDYFKLEYVCQDVGTFLQAVDACRVELTRERHDVLSEEIDALLEMGPAAFARNCCTAVVAGDVPPDLLSWEVHTDDKVRVSECIDRLVRLGGLVASYFGGGPALRCSDLLKERVTSRMRLAPPGSLTWISRHDALSRWRSFVRSRII